MRLADIVFRQGHLSERSITDAVMTGDRPVHLDRCDLCADRAVELGRWLDDVKTLGVETADAAFPPEQLAAQQAQILRRLELLDEPARVISFPRYSRRLEDGGSGGRRVAASWVAVAAAAGLFVGIVGGQYTAWLAAPAPESATLAETLPPGSDRPIDASYLQQDFDDSLRVPSLDLIDEITPRVVQVSARAGG